MKGGRRKETPPDHIPVTKISSFKLFNPLFNFETFHDAATLLAAQTGMAGKKKSTLNNPEISFLF